MLLPLRDTLREKLLVRTCSVRPSVLLLSVLLVLALIGLGWIVANLGDSSFMVNDFVEYWSAGRLNLTGGNPYSADDLFPLQISVGWDDTMPVMMWNPPPTLTLAMPFGLLDYTIAYVVWMVGNFLLLLIMIDQLWLIYGGKQSHRWVAFLVGFSFMPTLFVLRIGQIGVFILAGLVGFLVAERHHRLWVAGAMLPLVFIKPHVAYLFWVMLAIWWLRERRWSLVGGALVSVGIAWLIPMLINPQVNQQYLTATTTVPPFYWVTMTWGVVMRTWLGWERTWLSFVPPLLGCIWFCAHIWRTRHQSRSWTEDLPWILLLSTSTMAFGWPYDLVILLPALLQMTIWVKYSASRHVKWLVLSGFVVFEIVAFILNHNEASAVYYVWMAPVLLIAYWWLQRYVQQRTSVK